MTAVTVSEKINPIHFQLFHEFLVANNGRYSNSICVYPSGVYVNYEFSDVKDYNNFIMGLERAMTPIVEVPSRNKYLRKLDKFLRRLGWRI